MIYAVFLRFNTRSFSRYCARLADAIKKDKESQKMDDLPVLATCQSDTSAMLSGKVNSPAVYENTQ